MKHFEYYPKIEYCDNTATNIMVRGIIRDHIKTQNVLFYDYTIQDGDRPDTLSSQYYGSAAFTWVIFYANDILDPLRDWPLSPEDFYDFIVRKYGSVESAQTTVHHYLKDGKYIIDQTTYEDIFLEAGRKKIITEYEYEFDINESKRNIKIIDSIYVSQITNELRNLF